MNKNILLLHQHVQFKRSYCLKHMQQLNRFARHARSKLVHSTNASFTNKNFNCAERLNRIEMNKYKILEFTRN